MNKPKVSIVIPSYNSGEFIKRTIDSVLNQSFDDYEIIIVDDCSKDNTEEILKEYDDKRIKFYKNEENLGLAGNWNKCIELSSGEYVKLLCADDVIYKEALMKEVKALDENKNASIVISDTDIVNKDDKISFTVKRFNKNKVIDGKKLAKKSILFKNYFGAPCNTMFKKSIVDKIGYFDKELKYVPDYDLWIRLAYKGDVVYLKEVLSAFRIHEISNTSQLISGAQDEYTNDHIKLVKKHMKLGVIKITNLDLYIHITMRKVRNFMLVIFMKFFVNRR